MYSTFLTKNPLNVLLLGHVLVETNQVLGSGATAGLSGQPSRMLPWYKYLTRALSSLKGKGTCTVQEHLGSTIESKTQNIGNKQADLGREIAASQGYSR